MASESRTYTVVDEMDCTGGCYSMPRELNSCVGLESLCSAWQRETGKLMTPAEAVHRIRQINVGKGCAHACDHCFASPSTHTQQMMLESFRRFADEIGVALRTSGRPLAFCYLGAETDIAVIRHAADYLRVWLDALPHWQPLKLYTHGWVLNSRDQMIEMEAVLALLAERVDRVSILGLSIDAFSAFAKTDFESYILNAAANLRAFHSFLPVAKLKLQVTYPVDRLDTCGPATLRYHTTLHREGADLGTAKAALDVICSRQQDDPQGVCARLTASVLEIGCRAGLSHSDTVAISHDNGPAFPAGRAIRFYRQRNETDIRRALTQQIRTCLRPLNSHEHGFNGLIIDVDGSVPIVDYLGYRVYRRLLEGRRIIPYIRHTEPQPRPWIRKDFRHSSKVILRKF